MRNIVKRYEVYLISLIVLLLVINIYYNSEGGNNMKKEQQPKHWCSTIEMTDAIDKMVKDTVHGKDDDNSASSNHTENKQDD